MLDIADKYERVGKFIERQRLDLLKQPPSPFIPPTASTAARPAPRTNAGHPLALGCRAR
jgi:hypothetical protein